jgi:solute:Na+ symporter, SSS family
MPGLTLAFLIAYLASVLAIGIRARRRAGRDEIAYFVADRSLNTFWGFIGLASLTTGGSTTIALAALVYQHGLSGLWLDLSGALGLFALSLWLAGRVRREGAVTLPEIVGRHFGGRARMAAGFLVLVSEIVWFALLIEATQVVLTAAFGWPPIAAIVGSTAVFVLYTSMGGQFAVVRTDLVQYGLMVLGIPVVALAAALARSRAWAGLPKQVWSFPASPTLPPEAILALLVTIGLPHLVGSDVYAKLLSCRDEATARAAAAWAGVSKIVFGLSVAAIALTARAVLPSGAAVLTLPRAVIAFVPTPLASLVLVCLVATMHSSADAVLLSASAVTARDLVAPLARRPTALWASKTLAPVYGALGLAVALAMNRNVIETLKLGYSIFAAGLILPILTALSPAGRRVAPGAAIVSMGAGGAIAAAGRFWPPLALGRDPVLAGTAACGLVLTVALVWPRRANRRPSAPASR